MRLRGNWFVEVSEWEMTQIRAASLATFTTRSVDTYSRLNARSTTEFPRRCVLIGTANGRAYLKRTTCHHFLPIELGNIDLKSISEIRDQLFAEAVWQWRQQPAGDDPGSRQLRERWLQLPPNLEATAKLEQQKRVPGARR